jgi:transposase
MSTARKGYPSDVSDDEWTFVAPYLTLQSEQALQRKYELREVYNGLLLSGPHRRPMADAVP